MKNIRILSGLILVSLIVLSCDSNTKLSQANAEKVVSEFLLSTDNRYFQTNPDITFGTLNQFTDNEANISVSFSYLRNDFGGGVASGEIHINCVFKKNVDEKWIFTSIEQTNSGNPDFGGFFSWIDRNQDINIVAQ